MSFYNRGFQQITSLSSATGLTIPTGADGQRPNHAVIHCEGQATRWRDDGADPSTTVGMRLLVGAELVYDGDLSKIRFIEELSGAKLNISYYIDTMPSGG